MATAEENNSKRRPLDDEQSSSPRPPPKKRLVSSASSSPAPSLDGDNDSGQEDNVDHLEDFRKDAAFRQWKEYKRMERRWRKQSQKAEADHHSAEELVSSWSTHLQQLRSAVDGLVTEQGLKSLEKLKLTQDENTSNSRRLKDLLDEPWATEEASNITSAVKTLVTDDPLPLQYANAWRSKRVAFSGSLRSMLDATSLGNFLHDYEDSLSSWNAKQQSLSSYSQELGLAASKYLSLSEEVRLTLQNVKYIEDRARDIRIELLNAENRLSKSGTENSQAAAESSSSRFEENVRADSDEVEKPGLDGSQDPLLLAKQALDNHMRDIEEIKDQRIDLKQKIAQLDIDILKKPEHHIYKSSIVRQLYQAQEYYRDKSRRNMDVCINLQKDIDNIRNNRRRFIRNLECEHNDHIDALQEKLGRREHDLTETRGQRDALQAQVEERKVNVDYRNASTAELRLIAEQRKERTCDMETELHRLNLKKAAMTGDRTFYNTIADRKGVVLSKEVLESELEALMVQYTQSLKHLSGEAALQDQLEANAALTARVADLSTACELFQEKYGFPPEVTDKDEALRFMKAKIDLVVAAFAEAEVKIKALEESEFQVLSEIESVSKGYSDLEGQNLGKIEQLKQIEDDFQKLRIERARCFSAFGLLNKTKDSSQMAVNALRRQIEKELVYIRQLNERERNLSSHCTMLDRQQAAGDTALEVYTQKNSELEEISKDLSAKMASAKDTVIELERSIMDKIKSIEQGAHERLRLEESSELLRRKINASTKVGQPASLLQQKEDYRALLNCGSCRMRIKSTVLMRCMHAFCKECIDSQIKSRQRRCPTCAEPIGLNDAQQFYF
ncbi:hypothetical protein BCR43DRAFT_482838 [Syncephalastrum racemosum]|uniref:E3 ubiquitin protein ligase n=1 Tax=Syncephalastrum racemosum TaxID=13706 RepID=A0A1X2HUB4_SYNRA|nr:hypothetical protein BCR43DRAFT_482838 [Syncephalastrum racemosum]